MDAVLPKLVSTFALAFVSFWTSIPAGLALGLLPVLVALTAWLSYTAGVILMVLLGDPLRARLLKRFGGSMVSATTDPNNRMRRIWDKYGLLGLGFLAPMTTGSHIGALIGLSLGASGRPLIIAMSAGAAVWSVILTAITVLTASAIAPG